MPMVVNVKAWSVTFRNKAQGKSAAINHAEHWAILINFGWPKEKNFPSMCVFPSDVLWNLQNCFTNKYIFTFFSLKTELQNAILSTQAPLSKVPI